MNERQQRIDYALSSLNNNDYGSGVFQELANILVNITVAPNLMPASMPSSGGDRGVDGRSYNSFVDIDYLELLLSGRNVDKNIEEGEIVIAISIDKNIKKKILSDVQKIKNNIEDINDNFNPKNIYFLTNQKISPEKTKQDIERESSKLSGCRVIILDKSFFLQELSQNHYQLAIDYLNCPKDLDPLIQKNEERKLDLIELGLLDNEVDELEQIRLQLRYRNTTKCPRQEAANLALQTRDYFMDIELWRVEFKDIFESIINAKGFILPYTLSRIYYHFFLSCFGSFKEINEDKNTLFLDEIYKKFSEYRKLIIEYDIRPAYKDLIVWINALTPHVYNTSNQHFIIDESYDILKAIDTSNFGMQSKAYLDEALLSFHPSLLGNFEKFIFVIIEGGNSFFEKYKDLTLYDFSDITNLFIKIQDMIIDSNIDTDTILDQLDELARKFEQVTAKQNGKFEIVESIRNKAIKLLDERKDIIYALSLLDEVKYAYLNHKTIRGFVLTSRILSKEYIELGLFDLARWELLSCVHLILNEQKLTKEELIHGLFYDASYLELKDGNILPYVNFSNIWLNIHLELKKDIKDIENYENNILLSLNHFRNKNRKLHDDIMNKSLDINGNIAFYADIALTNKDEFQKFIENEDMDTQAKLIEVRKVIFEHTAIDNIDFKDNGYDDNLENKWSYHIDNKTINIHIVKTSEDSKPLEFMINVILQRFFVVCEDIVQSLSPLTRTLPIFIISDLPDDSKSEIVFEKNNALYIIDNDDTNKKFLNTTNENFLFYFHLIIVSVLNLCTMSSHKLILEQLEPSEIGDIIESFYKVIPPYNLMAENNIFSEILRGKNYE